MFEPRLRPFPLGLVQLLPSLFTRRFELNRAYVMSLKSENLLQNFYWEAGLRQIHNWIELNLKPTDFHWGWESPTSQIRGHFLGHWLSAAARIYAATGDTEVKAKADGIVSELARCQQENGGEWVGPIPEKYFHRLARGRLVWVPQYVLHKTHMGLIEMHTLAGNGQALEILNNSARWFHRWTGQFSREQMDDILDVETGGMLEAWADLYAITGKEEHLDLLRRYDRPRLFERLLAGEDVLTNMHANTTIPEIHGAARAWEVTGEKRWREIVEAYWRSAVTERGYFCTGGQTLGEFWAAPFELSARLGSRNQEHCTVYNMMRLADYLLRWTGDPAYADYWERNLYNGILAQQHSQTGMVAYFLGLGPGSTKGEGRGGWGTPTDHFWCCHGTLVQAHAIHNSAVFYECDNGIALCQYIPSELTWQCSGAEVRVKLEDQPQTEEAQRPKALSFKLTVACDRPVEFTLKVRLPWWLSDRAVISVNNEPQEIDAEPTSFAAIRRTWKEDTVRVDLPKRLTTCPLPDKPDTMAFMDGPVVLAGLCDEERTLHGDKENPETMLIPDSEFEHGRWNYGTYRTHDQERGMRFVPLYQISDDRYTVHFPVRDA